MILYNVTVQIEREIAEEWLQWMKKELIPLVMDTRLFVDYKIFRLLMEEEGDNITYAIQYFAKSIEDINKYIEGYASEFQDVHNIRYKDRHVAFRTLLESV